MKTNSRFEIKLKADIKILDASPAAPTRIDIDALATKDEEYEDELTAEQVIRKAHIEALTNGYDFRKNGQVNYDKIFASVGQAANSIIDALRDEPKVDAQTQK